MKSIKDRKERLKQLEQDKEDNLCPICRKKAKRENGKWVKAEIKSYPNRSGNNKVYLDFIREARKQDRYKDLPYPQFVREVRDDYYEWKKNNN